MPYILEHTAVQVRYQDSRFAANSADGRWRKMKGAHRGSNYGVADPLARRFIVGVRTERYEASLERNKIYTVMPREGPSAM